MSLSFFPCMNGSLTNDGAHFQHTQVRLNGGDKALAVSVSNNIIDYSLTSAIFSFIPVMTISSIMPTSGPSTGGTLITLKGTGFRNVSTLTCHFGSGIHPQPAMYISSSEIICITPARARRMPATVSPAVSCNGADLVISLSSPFFTYLEPPIIQSIYPSSGKLAGGTLIQVRSR